MVDYHLLNIVNVLQPRWSTRDILPKVKKFKDGGNVITIKHANYPSKYYMTKKKADTYHQEQKTGSTGEYMVYVIPLDDLETVQEHAQRVELENNTILRDVRRIFG